MGTLCCITNGVPVGEANHLRLFGRTGNAPSSLRLASLAAVRFAKQIASLSGQKGNSRKMGFFQKNICSDGTSMSGAMQTESAMVEKFRIFPQKPTVDQLIILILWRYMRSHMMIRGSVVGF